MAKIVIAQWLMDEAVRLGVADQTTLIPNAIDRSLFHRTRPAEGRPPTVAMLWSAAPIKGGEIGLEALQLARSEVPNLRAILFGVGSPPKALPDWVEYARSVSGARLVDEVYNRARVYLCPSRGEGWHLPPAEAMACGCAVVTTDIPGVADYAHDGRTALVAPVDDAAGLAARLVEVLTDDELHRRLVAEADRELDRFSWDRSTEAFESLLEGAAR